MSMTAMRGRAGLGLGGGAAAAGSWAEAGAAAAAEDQCEEGRLSHVFSFVKVVPTANLKVDCGWNGSRLGFQA